MRDAQGRRAAGKAPAPVGKLLRDARRLVEPLDAELLLAHLLGVERWRLLMEPERLVPQPDRYALLLARRAGGEPLAYITGEKEFWSLPIRVNGHVLIPRPDSETLIEVALDALRSRPPARILDLGTGSGALLLAALAQWPEATGLGTDISAEALEVAKANARALGLDGRAAFALSDWGAAVDGRFDLLLCNPPYIADGTPLMRDVAEHEPHGALFGGRDGTDHLVAVLGQLSGLLAPDGLALLEFGEGQEQLLPAIAAGHGIETRIFADLAGRPRVLACRVDWAWQARGQRLEGV